MKIEVLVTAENNEFGIVLQERIMLSSEAMKGRPEQEIASIVELYVKDWLYQQLNVRWIFMDQGSFGLEFKPSESTDD